MFRLYSFQPIFLIKIASAIPVKIPLEKGKFTEIINNLNSKSRFPQMNLSRKKIFITRQEKNNNNKRIRKKKKRKKLKEKKIV